MQIKISTFWNAFEKAYPAMLEEEIRMNYSGRFMFGKSCLGVVGDPSTLGCFIAHIATLIPELRDYDLVSTLRWDNMGLDMIYYWPDIQIIDDTETNA